MRKNVAGRKTKKGYPQGFSLIEVCIVLVISGLALASAMELLKQYQAREVVKVNNERIATIRQAMSAHIGRSSRLPCAAARNLASTAPAYGQESCAGGAGTVSVQIGAVPVNELNLPNSYMSDSWGNLFVYAVTRVLTDPATFNQDSGAITLLNPTSGPAPGANLTPNGAMYVVLSPGKNARGAWSTEGRQMFPCAGAGHDSENCDDDATFNAAPFSTEGAARHFDDLIAYSTEVNETVFPICGPGATLTSVDGLTFTCKDLPATPKDCEDWQRLTSDGINFTCQDTPYSLPACAAGVLKRDPADSMRFICAALPVPPPQPKAVKFPPCGLGQVLDSVDGATFVCQDVKIGVMEKNCTGYDLGGGWWGCSVNCPGSTKIAGGGADYGAVFQDTGSEASQSGNGFFCKIRVGSCSSGSGGCGSGCTAICAYIQ